VFPTVESLMSPDTWLALVSLCAMEVVLGIDNVIFIAILVGKLPPEKRNAIRRLGIGLALIARIGLLLGITWVMGLKATLFTVWNQDITGRDLILLIGGLFLIIKATNEIHNKLQGTHDESNPNVVHAASGVVVAQIIAIDLVFSLDSVITAVGMVDEIWLMIVAVLVAVSTMAAFSGPITNFIEDRPTLKILALSFLMLIGVMLVADGFGQHIPKGYIYFAMAFSCGVEMINLRVRKGAPIHLKPGGMAPH
jgi:predicted tellurium resistance membrane protein TerC